ncbi:MAG: NAD(P)H-dependent flavin oxidoreductase [Streptomycetales bacterium]
MITTALTESWGLRHPIVQAPMAGVSGGELAEAVARAGGLGFIGIGGAASPEWVTEQAALARGAGGRWGFGLLAWHVASRPEIVDAVLREEPDVVAVSFGDPAPYVGPCHDAGVRIVAQVQDREIAERAAAAGVDALAAQGTDAGGHTGRVGTLPLLQLVLRVGAETGLPVLAAGGIATGAGLAAVLAAGAAGGWIGTRFSATGEALGSDRRKRRLLEALETGTVHTRVFDIAQSAPWPEEYPGRALRNDFTARWHGHENDLAADPSAAGALERARSADDFSTMHVYAGQAVGLVDDVPPAGELVVRLSREAESLLRRAATLVE